MSPKVSAGLAVAAGSAYLCWEIAREDDARLRLFLAGCAVLTLGAGTALIMHVHSPAARPPPATSIRPRLHLVTQTAVPAAA